MVSKAHDRQYVPFQKGFTIIELLVAMGVILLVTGGVIAAFNSFNETQRVKQSAVTLKSNLRYAQNRALSGDKPATGCTRLDGYWVNFTSSAYGIRAFCEGAPVGEVTTVALPSGVTFNPVPLPILFAVLTGRTDADATLTVVGTTTAYAVLVTSNGNVSTVGF